ncbi:PEP-CTERM sorting domain-containing protein [Parvularcula dongshanensis]|uniref:VPLPA-CTERM sorting domain-containing protein n=1 Tax=Parvularcula dongshanensis TaxID=1173995 RepID=A0A840I647_9PROT|nr:PEP-CTERM sorting domain-containing protein [Parvularcula dongshanensis]MBB4659733.1 hypothetical protein [Parvularcula dongshanensis]
MKFAKKLGAIGAVSALALGIGTAAHAEIVVVSDSNVVTSTSPVRIENNDVNDGGVLVPANNTIDIVAGADVGLLTFSFDVDQSMPTPEGVGIYDFMLSVNGDMGTTGMFTITDDEAGNGNQILNLATLGVMPGETLTLVFSGTGFSRDNPFSPQYTAIINGDAIPVPAAGLLFLTAAAGGGLMRKKKKADA